MYFSKFSENFENENFLQEIFNFENFLRESFQKLHTSDTSLEASEGSFSSWGVIFKTLGVKIENFRF